jgi:hypothetical protein
MSCYEYWEREAQRHEGQRGTGARHAPTPVFARDIGVSLLHHQDGPPAPHGCTAGSPRVHSLAPPWSHGVELDAPTDTRCVQLTRRGLVPGHGAVEARRELKQWASGPTRQQPQPQPQPTAAVPARSAAHALSHRTPKVAGLRSGGGGIFNSTVETATYGALQARRRRLQRPGEGAPAWTANGRESWFRPRTVRVAWEDTSQRPPMHGASTPATHGQDRAAPDFHSTSEELQASLRRARQTKRGVDQEIKQLEQLSVSLHDSGGTASVSDVAVARAHELRAVSRSLQCATDRLATHQRHAQAQVQAHAATAAASSSSGDEWQMRGEVVRALQQQLHDPSAAAGRLTR